MTLPKLGVLSTKDFRQMNFLLVLFIIGWLRMGTVPLLRVQVLAFGAAISDN